MGDRTPPPVEPADARKHIPPHWAGEPTQEYSLEVIKDGVTLQTLPISDRDHFIVGARVVCGVFSRQYGGTIARITRCRQTTRCV